MKNYNLNDIDNYKINLEDSESVLFLKYVGLIHELIECLSETLNIPNKEYLKQIIITGIINISYIYNFVLLYTNNLELTIYHTQKAIIYYIEFVGQICEDKHNLLKLNTKDATLFIYKKTIFEINDDHRMNFNETIENKNILDLLHYFMDIYNRIVINMIETHNFTEDGNLKTTQVNSIPLEANKLVLDKHSETKSILDPNYAIIKLQTLLFGNAYKIVETLIQIPLICNRCDIDCKSKLSNIKEIVFVIITSKKYNFIQKNYWYLLESIIKKGIKKTISIDILNRKIINMDNDKKLQNVSTCKIANYLSNF
jgi:hypothetical protein